MRLGSLARVAPETGWNHGNHRQNPFCHRVTFDAFIVTPALTAAAVRCGCLSFLNSTRKGGIHHELKKPLSSFVVHPPDLPTGSTAGASFEATGES